MVPTHKLYRTAGSTKLRKRARKDNLPGIEDTVIKQAVPPGGDLCIALGQVEACDLPKRGRLGCAIFGSGGLRSRVPRTFHNLNQKNTLHFEETLDLYKMNMHSYSFYLWLLVNSLYLQS